MKKDIYEHFTSIVSLMKALETREDNKVMRGVRHSYSGSYSFTGTHSYKEAIDLLNNGWTEKLDEVKKKFNTAVSPNANARMDRIRPTNGIVGYVPCVPNAIRGLPNSMITTERIPQKVKAVSIVYSTCVNADFESSDLMKCGVAIMQIVNNLELAGYRIKLVLEAKGSEGDYESTTLHVDLKDYRQPLDLKKLCFPMIHTSMFRRIGFKWLETVPDLTDGYYRSGYGYSVTENYEKRKQFLKETLKCIGENDFYVTAYMIKANKFDVEKVMEQAGMTCLK